jgi:adenylyl-sulfate kinase
VALLRGRHTGLTGPSARVTPPGPAATDRRGWGKLTPMSAAPGVTVFLTGFSGAGKSTIADALISELEAEGRPVTVLDGDVVRTHLSSELSFSREHRDLNIRRIGWVAGEVVKHGGTVVVAAIAPYEAAREQARALVEKHGRFVLVHLSTPLEVCEQRDVKCLYAKARAGEIPEFTGVSDPYEPPARAEVVVDTSVTPLEESVALIRAAMNGH